MSFYKQRTNKNVHLFLNRTASDMMYKPPKSQESKGTGIQ